MRQQQKKRKKHKAVWARRKAGSWAGAGAETKSSTLADDAQDKELWPAPISTGARGAPPKGAQLRWCLLVPNPHDMLHFDLGEKKKEESEKERREREGKREAQKWKKEV